MRKLVVTTFLTLDWGDGVARWSRGRFRRRQDFLLGRATYEMFVGHWPRVPTEEDPVSKALNTLPKHVAPRTLDRVDWDGARLIKSDVAEAVATLKAQDGGELRVHGGAGLIQTRLKDNLIDELRLMIFPVVLGEGKKLFADGTVPSGLSLTSSSATGAGVVILTYQLAGDVEVRLGRHRPD